MEGDLWYAGLMGLWFASGMVKGLGRDEWEYGGGNAVELEGGKAC